MLTATNQHPSLPIQTQVSTGGGGTTFESQLGTNNHKIPKQSHVIYDIEEAEQDDLQTDMENNPEDGGTSKLIDGQEPETTLEDLDDHQDELCTTWRSTQKREPID
jgi:hypothetical protein